MLSEIDRRADTTSCSLWVIMHRRTDFVRQSADRLDFQDELLEKEQISLIRLLQGPSHAFEATRYHKARQKKGGVLGAMDEFGHNLSAFCVVGVIWGLPTPGPEAAAETSR